MKTMLFISRHVPTEEQIEIARQHGYDLIHDGDADAFDKDDIGSLISCQHPEPDAVAVVHPAAAMHVRDRGLTVGVFENENRAPLGEKPQFHCKALHIFEVI